MNKDILASIEDDADQAVDIQIGEALALDHPVSFFLFAGAGSGKTRSLVTALRKLRDEEGKRLRTHGQRIGVITYTKKARDEIKARLDYDAVVEVSTIHSFVWSLIGNFHRDIKAWLESTLSNDIAEPKTQQAKGRAGTKAAMDRERDIEAKTRRLANLINIRQFTYNPDGENRGKDSLNHGEVIDIGANFLVQKALMQSLVVNKFPILLLDESQDTHKALMEALLIVQNQQKERFALGLFGDTMQRIYAHGKTDLGQNLPLEWAKPTKTINHRSCKRIIKLINKIRSEVDEHEQSARTDKEEGFARLFILQNTTADKPKAEQEIAERMAVITGDALWAGPDKNVKMLILEHHMAARRMGFLEMYKPLYENHTLNVGLLDGSLAGLRLFSDLVLPLIKNRDDSFAAASVIRKHSPLLSKQNLRSAGNDQTLQIKKAREAVQRVQSLCANGKSPTFLEVLFCIYETQLFDIPEHLNLIASRNEAEQRTAKRELAEASIPDEAANQVIDAWDKFLLTPFEQIEPYQKYVSHQASFDTHQGVKGLEFPRVMVIIDDTEARGFSFSYEKPFGAKDKTKGDLENEREGKETGIDRTRRLFYVTCSRAERSLAIVAYSENPQRVRDHVTSQGWFGSGEIETW